MTVKGKGAHQFSRRTFHSLRHSFNSALANAGVSQKIRVKFTGHSSNAITGTLAQQRIDKRADCFQH